MNTGFSVDIGFCFLWITSCGGIAGLYAKGVFHFKRDTKLFDLGAVHFAFPPAMYGSSECAAALPTAGITKLLDFSHFSGCVVISHCVFNE